MRQKLSAIGLLLLIVGGCAWAQGQTAATSPVPMQETALAPVAKVPPIYPPLARQSRVEGTVVLHVLIGTDGQVKTAAFISGPGLLVQAATDAVRQWKYRPVVLDGKAVEVDTTITVTFTLGSAASSAGSPAYSIAEYNAYQAATAQKDPQQNIRLLDSFVATYPDSAMLPFVYRIYYRSYFGLKNYAQTLLYVDKLLGLESKVVDDTSRLEAEIARAYAYSAGASSDKSLQTSDAENKARKAAERGLQLLEGWQKPIEMTAEQYQQQKKDSKNLFNKVAAMSSTSLSDYPAAANFYRAVLSVDSNDAFSHYHLGIAYLLMNPPQPDDGFWEMARSIALKGLTDAEKQQVHSYFKNTVRWYEQTSCDALIDDQINDGITLAAKLENRPANWHIPNAADLAVMRDDTANFIPTLMAGGEAGKAMWLATCGLEYPGVVVKVMDAPVRENGTITFTAYRPGAQDPDAFHKELDSATKPNMEVKVVGPPDALRIKKNSLVVFTGTLVGYSQDPFLLTWNNATSVDSVMWQKKQSGEGFWSTVGNVLQGAVIVAVAMQEARAADSTDPIQASLNQSLANLNAAGQNARRQRQANSSPATTRSAAAPTMAYGLNDKSTASANPNPYPAGGPNTITGSGLPPTNPPPPSSIQLANDGSGACQACQVAANGSQNCHPVVCPVGVGNTGGGFSGSGGGNNGAGSGGGQNNSGSNSGSSSNGSSPSGSAQQTMPGGQFNNCISSFYDPAVYNWLAFKNNCTQALSVTYIFRTETGVGSTGDPGPGASFNTGYSAAEISARNGYELYICLEGYLPVDANGKFIQGGTPPKPFACKAK
jgi:TonB family protein